MTPVSTHKVFGSVTPIDSYQTVGGNDCRSLLH